MQNILLKIGIVLGVSSASAFVSSTGIAMVVGFLVYNVNTGYYEYALAIASLKFVMAVVFVWPLGIVGGIIGGLAGWLKASDVPDTNRRIVKWSAVGGLLAALFPACVVGVYTIA